MTRPFTVELNGKPLEIPEGDDLSSLEVGFFCTAHWALGNLYIGGLRSRGGAPVHTEPISLRIPRGSTLRIDYLEGPSRAPLLDMKQVDKAFDEIRAEFEESRAKIDGACEAAPPPEGARLAPRALSRKLIEVSIDGRVKKISAALDESAQLQANAYWNGGQCTFRVNSIFVDPNGNTTGEQFIHLQAQPGQEMVVTYVL